MKHRQILPSVCIFLAVFFPLGAQESDPVIRTDTSAYIPGNLDFNLIIAAERGYTGEVLRLLNAGAHIDARTSEGVTALMYAAQSGDALMTELLLLNGADPNLVPDNGFQALHGAILNNHIDIARRLIQAGADVNAPGPERVRPLMLAVLEDYYLCDLLLRMGADIDLTDAGGTTALMVAALAGKYNILERLVMDGAEVNASDLEGFTPLMCAVQGGDTLSVKKLLEAGANLDHRNRYGVSSLELAIVYGHTELVALLLQNGASPNENIPGNLTAMQLARSVQKKETMELLREHGGKRSFNPVFSTAYGGVQAGGNHTDFQTGFLLGIRETSGSVRFETGFSMRPWEKRTLVGQAEELYLQLWEKRVYGWIAIQKEWSRFAGPHLSPFIGLKALYSWGSYQATERVPPARFRPVPQAGFSTGDGRLWIRLYAEYIDLNTTWVFPARFQFELLWHFDLSGKKYWSKSLTWLD